MKEIEFKVMAAFYPDISAELNPNNVSKKMKLSYGGTYQTLLALHKKKVLIRRKVGNTNIYKLNPRSDMLRGYLVALSIQKKVELYSAHRAEGEALSRLVERVHEELGPKFHLAVLFGSFVKNERREESDIDILFLLDLETETKEYSKLVGDICSTKSMETGRDINPIIVYIKEFEEMLRSSRRNISHEIFLSGIPIYGAENYLGILLEWMRWRETGI